jgi:predicted O-methyltransferase YrrM
MFYDSIKDVFYYPKSKGYWNWNEELCTWEEIDSNYPANWYWTMGASDFFDRNMTEFIDKPNLRFLEIGSWVGTSAIEQVKNVLSGNNSTITCVDIWSDSKVEEYFDERTATYANKIAKIKNNSKIWLEQNQDQLFDFIYVDGDHTAESIEADTRLSWAMLKIGGVMALDDVLLNNETEQANNAFMESVKDKATIIENGYQIWLRKTTN